MFVAALLLGVSPAFPTDPLAVRDLAPFAALDAAVRRLPLPAPRTFSAVAKALVAVAPSPLERARAAYVWTVSHVAYSLDRSDAPGGLAGLSGDCDAHAAIYGALCKAMGVECAAVGGSIRYAVPPPAALASVSKPLGRGQWLVPHAWDAVRIDGRWGLVDTTMGVRSRADVAAPDDYFLADPTVLATDHVPDDDAQRLAGAPSDLARTPLLRPLAWRMGLEPTDVAATSQIEGTQIVLRPRLAWRRGMRIALQTDAGSLADVTLVQPGVVGTEVRLCPPGVAVAWLGFGTGVDWQPIVGYPVWGAATRRLPRLMSPFYDTGAILQGPFEGELPGGRTSEIRLRAPGASQVVAFQGEDPVGSFVREDGVWTLRAQPTHGVPLDVMASYDDPRRFQGLVTYDVR